MKGIILFNDSYVPAMEAKVSVLDPAFLYGEGGFSTLCVREGTIECLEKHMHRLAAHCQQLELPFLQFSNESLLQLLLRNEAKRGWWRLKLVVTSHLRFAYVQPYSPPSAPASLGCYPTLIERPSAHIKSLAYLDRILIQRWAKLHTFTDAVTRSADNWLLETAFSNFFWIHQQTLYTPCPSLPLLQGIALEGIQAIINRWGWQQHAVRLRIEDIPKDALVFTCNSLTGPHPVRYLADHEYRIDVDIATKLQQAYREWACSTGVSH